MIVSDRNNKLETPLHVALRQMFVSVKTVEALLKAGASVETRDIMGNSCLDLTLKQDLHLI